MDKKGKLEGIQVRSRNLEEGMVLVKPVYSRDGSRLFPEGKNLNGSDIQRLKDWNIRYVYIKPDQDQHEPAAQKVS